MDILVQVVLPISLAVIMFSLGLGLRALAPGFVARIEGLMMRLSVVLFAIIVVAAIASNWALFVENLARLGPATASLVVITLGFGLLVGAIHGVLMYTFVLPLVAVLRSRPERLAHG